MTQSLDTDWKKVCQRKATAAEELQGKVPLSQFGRICQKPGIRIIVASSAQAKGRVGRIHSVHQDRLIKKLRRKKIASCQAANEYLENEYLPEHNRRFARQAAKPENYHRRKPTACELHEIFRAQISNDWVIRHEGRYLPLQPAGQSRYGPTHSKVVVCEWEDGAVEVYYRGQRLAYQELPAPLPRKSEVEARAKPRVRFFGKANKPSPDRPLRQGYDGMKPSWSKKIAMPLLRNGRKHEGFACEFSPPLAKLGDAMGRSSWCLSL